MPTTEITADSDDDDGEQSHPTTLTWPDLSAFQRDLLWVLKKQEPTKGTALLESLEDYYRADVNHGRLYPNLDELVDGGLIEKGKYDERTNKYERTAEAKTAMLARREWEDA